MASASNGILPMQLHFIKKLLDDACNQLKFLNHSEQNNDLEKQKRSKDISQLRSLIKSLGHEITHHGTTSVLETFITHNLQEATKNHQLINDYFTNKQKLDSLELQLHQANTRKSILLQELDQKVTKAQSERDDVRLLEACRLRTVKRWEDTRCDQNAILFHMSEQNLSQELKELDEAIDDDRMISFHTERYLENCINDLLDTIGEWDDRITKETDELEISMQQLSERQFNFEKKKTQFEELYVKRKQAIDEINARIQEERELILMAKCSIKIQAWWRGVMVRKQLGPFKPKKSKKKKKGGKKKGKR